MHPFNSGDFSAQSDQMNQFPGMHDPFSSGGLPPNIVPQFLHDLLVSTTNDKNNIGCPEHNSRGSWTQEEDAALNSAVAQIGENKWSKIAKMIKTRSSKQCRERWMNCLKPGLKREPFERWEDEILIQKQTELGNHWAAIAHALPGRSPGAVKNRWYSGLKSQIQSQNNSHMGESSTNFHNSSLPSIQGIHMSIPRQIPGVTNEVSDIQPNLNDLSSYQSDISGIPGMTSDKAQLNFDLSNLSSDLSGMPDLPKQD